MSIRMDAELLFYHLTGHHAPALAAAAPFTLDADLQHTGGSTRAKGGRLSEERGNRRKDDRGDHGGGGDPTGNASEWTVSSAYGQLTPETATEGEEDALQCGAEKKAEEGNPHQRVYTRGNSASSALSHLSLPWKGHKAAIGAAAAVAVVATAAREACKKREDAICTARTANGKPHPSDGFGWGKAARPSWFFMDALERYGGMDTECRRGSCQTDSLSRNASPKSCSLGNRGTNTAHHKDERVLLREEEREDHRCFKKFEDYLQYYRDCEKEVSAAAAVAASNASHAASLSGGGSDGVRTTWEASPLPAIWRPCGTGARDGEWARAMWQATQQLPVDLGHCLAIANALQRHLTILKTVPPPPLSLLEWVWASAESSTQQPPQRLPLLPDCPCGCVRSFVMRCHSSYSFHMEQYKYSHLGCSIEDDYATYRASRLSASQRRRATMANLVGVAESAATAAATPTANSVLHAERRSSAANRCGQLPLLSAQLFATFQFRMVNELAERKREREQRGRERHQGKAPNISQQRMRDTQSHQHLDMSDEERHALYTQFFDADERLLIVAVCTLLAWKQLDRGACTEFLFRGPDPLWIFDEYPRFSDTPNRRENSGLGGEPLRYCWRLTADNHPFTQLRRKAFSREDASGMERFVFGKLDGYVTQLPLWWTVAVDTVEACFVESRVGACTRAAGMKLTIGETVMERREEVFLNRAVKRSYTEALHELTSLAECVLVECARQPSTPKRRKLASALLHDPFFGVALAVAAGVPRGWAERHVLGVPERKPWQRTLNDEDYLFQHLQTAVTPFRGKGSSGAWGSFCFKRPQADASERRDSSVVASDEGRREEDGNSVHSQGVGADALFAHPLLSTSAERHQRYARSIAGQLRTTICDVVDFTKARSADGRCYVYERQLMQGSV